MRTTGAKVPRFVPLGEGRNPNKHTQQGTGMLASAMNRHGYVAPMTAARNGVVLDGNLRLETSATTFPDVEPIIVEHDGTRPIICVRKDIKDERDPLALDIITAANRIAEVDLAWNTDVLKAFAAEGLDLAVYEWEPVMLQEITGVKAGLTDPDDVPAERATDIKAGDLFELGAHRLLCGDCTKAEDVALVMDGQRAALVVTSPPYNQGLDKFKPSGMHTETRWVANVQSGSYADSKPEDEYQAEQSRALKTWARFLREDGAVFYNHKNRYRDKQVVSPWRWLQDSGAKVRQEIIWKREGSVTQNARMFLPCDERVFWLYFGRDFYFDDSTEHKTWSSVWEINSHKDIGHSEHGCAFPVELAARPIAACSRVGDVVFEPYCGSGTTIIAAEQLGRSCRAIEIEPQYCQVIIDRWEQFVGNSAKAVKVGEAVSA